MTTVGKYRHLAQCSTPAGHFNVLAIDHRGAVQKQVAEALGKPESAEDYRQFKHEVISHLAPHTSGVLTDPDFGFPTVASAAFPGSVGVLAPLEVTDYSIHANKRPLKRIPDWSVAKMKRAGVDGIKLLVFYHPDAPNAGQLQEEVAVVIDECTQHDIPLFLEPIAFSLETGERDGIPNAELRRVVIDSAKLFCDMGADILKAQFPLDARQEDDEAVWLEACKELTDACGDVPWALLSAGVTYDVFRRQTEVACEAGASGVIVGRAAWAEAARLAGEQRTEWLTQFGEQRMRELRAIVDEKATSWRDRVPAPDMGLNWQASYEV